MLLIMWKRNNLSPRNPPGRKNAWRRTDVTRKHHHLFNYFQINLVLSHLVIWVLLWWKILLFFYSF